MAIIDGVDSVTRSYVYDPNASLGSKRAFWKAVGCTKAGQKLFEEFEIDEAVTGDVILQVARELNPGVRFITADMAADAVSVVVYRPVKYGLKRKPAEPVAPVAPVEPPQTDRNGKKLGASQLAWREHAEWARTATSEQIRKRKESDPSFRAFVVNSLKLEMTQPVDAAIPAAVQSTRSATGEDLRSELGEFAAAYRKAPAASVRRPIDGFFKLVFGRDKDGQPIEHIYTPQEFDILLTESAKIGLL
jgi:hypothetical protein